jgi:hypothetical protein
VEPDPELARHPELVEGFAVVPAEGVARLVARFAQGVEEVGDVAAHDAAGAEPAEEVDLVLLVGCVEARVRRGLLGEELAELT